MPLHVSSTVCSKHVLTYLLHGAESFLRSQLVCSLSRNSPHFTEPERSSIRNLRTCYAVVTRTHYVVETCKGI